ncbi:MAG: hypothetical protein R2752_13395 [Vicinamibacterales bacterium]
MGSDDHQVGVPVPGFLEDGVLRRPSSTFVATGMPINASRCAARSACTETSASAASRVGVGGAEHQFGIRHTRDVRMRDRDDLELVPAGHG